MSDDCGDMSTQSVALVKRDEAVCLLARSWDGRSDTALDLQLSAAMGPKCHQWPPADCNPIP